MASKGVVPTFFLNEQVINTDSDICAYILKFLFWNPGSTSNQIEQSLLSMRKMSATYAEDINVFPMQLGHAITNALQSYNRNWNCHVEVAHRDDENKTYGLLLKITDGSGNNLLTTDSLMIKDGYLTVRNEYEDTNTFNSSRSPRHPETSYSDINTSNAQAIMEKRHMERLSEHMDEMQPLDSTTDVEDIKQKNEAKQDAYDFAEAVKQEEARLAALNKANEEKPIDDGR